MSSNKNRYARIKETQQNIDGIFSEICDFDRKLTHFWSNLYCHIRHCVVVVIWWQKIKPNYVDTHPVNLHPLFLKMGHPAFWKKQAEKNRVILYSKREETRLPLLFLNYNDLGFLHSVFFKKHGVWFLRIVGADWLGEYVFAK